MEIILLPIWTSGGGYLSSSFFAGGGKASHLAEEPDVVPFPEDFFCKKT